MRSHITIVGIIYIVLGLLGLLGPLAKLLAMAGIAIGSGFLAGVPVVGLGAAGIVAIYGIWLIGFVAVIGLLGILGGIGLLQGKPWARILLIVLSVFMLLRFPFGTALGGYTLWVLFQEESERLFSRRERDPFSCSW